MMQAICTDCGQSKPMADTTTGMWYSWNSAPKVAAVCKDCVSLPEHKMRVWEDEILNTIGQHDFAEVHLFLSMFGQCEHEGCENYAADIGSLLCVCHE